VRWPEKGFRLRQVTKFPEQPSTAFIVSADQPVELALRLRIPSWIASGGVARINGKTLDAFAAPGSYLTLSRTWKTGDRVELELPMSLHVEAMPDDPKLQAFLYGPLVLAGDLGDEGLTEKMIVGDEGPRVDKSPIAVPSFRPSPGWIKPADKPLTFRTTGQEKDVTLAPFNTIFDRRYSVYWRVG
jgi:DUF1680 family protein